jgi:hypothetical protein
MSEDIPFRRKQYPQQAPSGSARRREIKPDFIRGDWLWPPNRFPYRCPR